MPGKTLDCCEYMDRNGRDFWLTPVNDGRRQYESAKKSIERRLLTINYNARKTKTPKN